MEGDGEVVFGRFYEGEAVKTKPLYEMEDVLPGTIVAVIHDGLPPFADGRDMRADELACWVYRQAQAAPRLQRALAALLDEIGKCGSPALGTVERAKLVLDNSRFINDWDESSTA